MGGALSPEAASGLRAPRTGALSLEPRNGALSSEPINGTLSPKPRNCALALKPPPACRHALGRRRRVDPGDGAAGRRVRLQVHRAGEGRRRGAVGTGRKPDHQGGADDLESYWSGSKA